MSHPLILTSAEQTLFNALSKELQNGWSIENEAGMYQDTPEKQKMRMAVMQLQNPSLMNYVQPMKEIQNAETLTKFVDGFDASMLSESDLSQILFGLGPTIITDIIVDGLKNAKTDEELDTISALTEYRHSFLETLAEKSM